MNTGEFRHLIEHLTGTPIKELSDDERGSNDRLLAPVIADDDREFDCSQFNELLLLVNKDRVEPAFFARFFPERALVRDLAIGVERFQKVAMLRYGNFVHAFRKLSRLATLESIEEELGSLLSTDSREPVTRFFSRSPKLIDVEHIAREDTPLVGFLSFVLLDREEKAAKVLKAAALDAAASRDWDAYVDLVNRSLQPPLSGTARSAIAAFRLRPASSIAEFRTYLDTALPEIARRAARGVSVQRTATQNQDIYLTWDHMDVYFATSMRKPWEFHDLYDFIDSLMSMPELSCLRLRYFDPTQCYTKLPVDKGLVECLMLKRAKCTVYSVQDSDTLGKDSELAATLAQGKPVIAFVPEIDVAERTERLLKDDPASILERLRFVLYADESFMVETTTDDYAFVASYAALPEIVRRTPFRSIPDAEAERFRGSSGRSDLERLCRVIAAAEKRIYDKRANTLKHFHPLAIQVNLDTGVANGVLVVRAVEECARLLRSVLTRTMDFTVHEEAGVWSLRERISGCIFRVATKNRKIDNCFWNFYLRDTSNEVAVAGHEEEN